MKYYSTNHNSPEISFKDAILKGLAPDRGLYMPKKFKKLNNSVYNKKNFNEMCFETAKILVDGEISDTDLKNIVFDAMNFEVPIKNINDNIYVLELFHGPTAAFKDFGARFLARTMSYIVKEKNEKITILVATSGDTGSAVARGFYKVPNIDVVLLYPKNKVSYLQEKQLTTLGENITALEVSGTFDDCQHMVKEAFIDKELNIKMTLSSANSINIGRLLPQSFYYIWAHMQLVKNNKLPVVFCTPSGNFGNLTSGLIAKKMGLNIKEFIAATNINDVVPEYLETGIFKQRPSIKTFSNAMDVGNPSNFARMLDIYSSKDNMKKDIIGYRVTDEETLDTIKKVYNNYNYILDPHGAVGYKSVEEYKKMYNDKGIPIILLETAHPAKFMNIIKDAIGQEIEIPETLQEALRKKKKSIEIENNIDCLKDYLLSRI